MLSTAQVNKNLKDMLAELRATRKSTSYLWKKIADGMPEQFMGAGNGDMSTEDETNLGGAEMATSPEEGQGPEGLEGEKKEQEIKRTAGERKKRENGDER